MSSVHGRSAALTAAGALAAVAGLLRFARCLQEGFAEVLSLIDDAEPPTRRI